MYNTVSLSDVTHDTLKVKLSYTDPTVSVDYVARYITSESPKLALCIIDILKSVYQSLPLGLYADFIAVAEAYERAAYSKDAKILELYNKHIQTAKQLKVKLTEACLRSGKFTPVQSKFLEDLFTAIERYYLRE